MMVTEPRFLLDTNIAIYLLDGSSLPAAHRVADCDVGTVVTSTICLAEMLVRLDKVQAERLPLFLASIDVLPFDDRAARTYAFLPFKRRSFDRLIAAHALALNLTVVTANASDFTDVPGLSVENWTRPL